MNVSRVEDVPNGFLNVVGLTPSRLILAHRTSHQTFSLLIGDKERRFIDSVSMQMIVNDSLAVIYLNSSGDMKLDSVKNKY